MEGTFQNFSFVTFVVTQLDLTKSAPISMLGKKLLSNSLGAYTQIYGIFQDIKQSLRFKMDATKKKPN